MAQFDPEAFLDTAEELLQGLSGAPTVKSNRDQAKVRSSISRSYYAAYLAAREAFHSLGRITPTGGPEDHQKIINALGGMSTERGGKLHRLRMKRNQADYNLNPEGFTLVSGKHWASIARELSQYIIGLNGEAIS
ncbi:MAG: hypothetical protein HYU86_07655 [Chloroflexi bacterium]|nr:hypothetical protein [Chloroflexota bacterium]